MKKILLLILLLFGFFLQSQAIDSSHLAKERPLKIGLSLSGGGAKGFAHIGLLKILDSLNVKVDYIAGSSMGAIMGSLYASGYSGKQIEEIVRKTDFSDMFKDHKERKSISFYEKKNAEKYFLSMPLKNGNLMFPSSISDGQKNLFSLKQMLKHVEHVSDFSQLPIPFMCTATNLETGKIKLFQDGDLALSVMASSAFPSLLDPVKIQDSLYVDGGIFLNYPSEPLKQKGMNVVIGMNLSGNLKKKEELNSIINILKQIIQYQIVNESKRQEQFTDINIHPQLTNIGITDFDKKSEAISKGHQEALSYLEPLDRLPKRSDNHHFSYQNKLYSKIYRIDSLQVINANLYNERYVKGQMGLSLPSMQSHESINKMIENLQATNNYKFVNYHIIQTETGNILKLELNEDSNKYYLRMGLHYDNVFKSGILLNFYAKRLGFSNSSLNTDLVLGDKPRYLINYNIDNGWLPGMGINLSGMSVDFINNRNLQNSDKAIDDEGSSLIDRLFIIKNEFYIQSVIREKFAIGGSISNDNIWIKDLPSNRMSPVTSYFNINAFIKYDSQDSSSFPTRGAVFNSTLTFFNLNKESNNKGAQLYVRYSQNIKISSKFTFNFGGSFGWNIDDAVPSIYNFRFGGVFRQSVLNFYNFGGVPFSAINTKFFVNLRGYIQYNLYQNFYLKLISNTLGSLNENYVLSSRINLISEKQKNDLDEFMNKTVIQQVFGVNLGYNYFIPINVGYNHNINNKKGLFYINLGYWF